MSCISALTYNLTGNIILKNPRFWPGVFLFRNYLVVFKYVLRWLPGVLLDL